MMPPGCGQLCMHGRNEAGMSRRRWWSRPLTSLAGAVTNTARRAVSACTAVLVPRKTKKTIASHPIQCKTWCTKHIRTCKYRTPLKAVVIKGKRYAGSSTCSMHRHLCKAHTAVFVRMLDDSLTGYRRHVHYRKLSGARPSGLYRTVLHSSAHAHYALLDRYPVLPPHSSLAPLDTACATHAHTCVHPMAHSLGGGGGDNSRRQSGAKQSVGTTLQQTALQHMTQRMLHQIDRLAGQAPVV